MANSLMLVSKLLGIRLTVCAPDRYQPQLGILKDSPGEGTVCYESDPSKAVAAAEFLYTDVWVSMGFENEERERVAVLQPYQLNNTLVAKAPNGVKVMHCLPAHRGMEITNEIMDGPASIVFDQAENRLHVQKAILTTIMTD
jgi:ornithine carbamoyltransferase